MFIAHGTHDVFDLGRRGSVSSCNGSAKRRRRARWRISSYPVPSTPSTCTDSIRFDSVLGAIDAFTAGIPGHQSLDHSSLTLAQPQLRPVSPTRTHRITR